MTALDLSPRTTTVPPLTRFVVGWAATDANAHMRSTAYLEAAIDSRVDYLQRNGWPMARFHARRIGPILLSDEVAYRRELRMGDVATIDLELAGSSLDGARFRLRNTIRRSDDHRISATVLSNCAFVDLDQRQLILPPAELVDVLSALPRTEDWVDLPSLGRNEG